VTGGGRLLLLGRVPCFDLTGAPCTVLADALGVRGLDFVTEQQQYFPTVTAHDWAAPWPQTRVGCLEHLDPGAGTVLLTDHDGVPCGVEVSAGSGRVVLFAAELPSNLHLFGRAFRPAGRHGAAVAPVRCRACSA
jgi:beta-galactosidase